ncbi:vq domain-containing protein [Abeliophyllum distichum]|uniref:Vq domain-containing protein n=1 Tax=Abeliophyllum distichum TaxID=126358 RepID=A0ABD1PRX7_9LAMI
MGKKPKSTQVPMKIPRKNNKKQITSLLKILRPKVYITDSSNFKTLVQQLTGNGNSTLLLSSPSPSPSISQPVDIIQDHAYQENSWDLSFDSSCFSTPLESSSCFSTSLESSPDLRIPETLGSKNMEFSESLLLEMDPVSYNYDACFAMIQQEVCVYDYGFSGFI